LFSPDQANYPRTLQNPGKMVYSRLRPFAAKPRAHAKPYGEIAMHRLILSLLVMAGYLFLGLTDFISKPQNLLIPFSLAASGVFLIVVPAAIRNFIRKKPLGYIASFAVSSILTGLLLLLLFAVMPGSFTKFCIIILVSLIFVLYFLSVLILSRRDLSRQT